MGELVSLRVASHQRDVGLEEAWERFRSAMLKSKETLRIEDGIAAGKAYREFLEVFSRKP